MRLAILAVPLLFAACQSGPPGSPPSAQTVTHQAIEFRLVTPPSTAGSTAFESNGMTLYLSEPAPFHVERVYPSMDAMNNPCLGFEIAEAEQAGFQAWTGEHRNQQLAVLVDGQVVTVPVINEALPGRGIINGGAEGFTAEEVTSIIERMTL